MADRHVDRGRPRLTATETDLGVARQAAVLVGTGGGARTTDEAEASLDELVLLADTAGADAVAVELQRREVPDPATYVGKGKAKELAELASALDADLVIFDDELSPAQQRNLEKLFKCDVVDRVALILDIFAQHAASQEGMVQVELAQLRYLLPRLRGRGVELSQQGAGIGTRGPGETQLEVDRRRIQRRISKLERQLEALARTRATQRKARRRRDLATVALVGYTNAGKSTLLNRLTRANVLVEDRLFSTLDPSTRRLRLPGGETVLASDTVGFVRRLPHELVEAFRSTLEEVNEADLVLHLVDAGEVDLDARIDAVRSVLREIGAGEIPEQLVFTKVDTVSSSERDRVVARHPGSTSVSAISDDGVVELLTTIGTRLRALGHVVELEVPYTRGDVLAALHREGEVLIEVHGEGGTRVRARIPNAIVSRYQDLVVADNHG
ncbi:MAG TPA: GTPase HflX [Acidimicrobiia bacterium]